ncbi:ABC transporter permease [Lutibaculum baratangense]|uniref:ABC-type antimicrobial peptide transport system, permease component n=1 Tax=Lutibaculum baratangense AMV1 TaxID=631454 RepID=V4TAA4_9HYPH|nr:ABC transporter permease [Lutibaculum baratangense]ESR23378.1 ABC-type antimicrobial peptide transport system, permease component [Lutibaculum baratangense AMV1]
MTALDRKVLRDLGRLWAQALAVALVLASGVATLVLAMGAYRSLDETREAYYERYRFGHVFAHATRAPDSLIVRIAAIEGVAAVEGRVVESVLLDVPGLEAPATAIAVSLPDHGEPSVNRLYLRTGRLPEPGRPDEVAVNENFATENRLSPGSAISALMDGVKRTLTITGTVLSPEYVYALGPGSLVPDNRHFGILFMSRRALGSVFDMEGAFDDLSLRLLRGADEQSVIAALDLLLAPYGGTGAYGRKDQLSHAFLDGELTQLLAMARIIPPIFLLVSAYLINMILSRLIALEREQVGLLKALGYSGLQIGVHYLKLVVVIACVGVVVGFAAGTWLGAGLTRLYGEFYSFPFLIFQWSVGTYLAAGAVGIAAAVVGALRAVHGAVALPPAIAMRPPAPPVFHHISFDVFGRLGLFSQLTVMALRHLWRWPLRAALSALGTSLAVSLLVVALFSFDSVEFMVDMLFFQSDRQDATISFAHARPPAVREAVLQLPGVMAAEPFQAVPVLLRHGHRERRLAITGKPMATDLSRVLDLDLQPVVLPETGLVLSERVAAILDVQRGDLVEVELLEGHRRSVRVPVAEVIQSYLGLMVFMNLEALWKLTGEGPRVSGMHVAIDEAKLSALYAAVKETPVVGSVALLDATRLKFRETIEQNMLVMTTVYVVLSVIIAFGVVYNSARIQLSERARELAGLRVLGFTRWEVSRVLLVELAIVTVLAQPLGWALGYGFAYAVIAGFESDLYRVPFVVERDTFAVASLVVMAAATASALLVRRRVDTLDLIRVLKTRD